MSNVSNVDVQSLWVCWSRSELLYSALIIFDWYALYSAFIFFHLLSYVLLRSLSCSRSIHRYQMKLAVFVDGVGPFRFALYTTRRSWRHRSVTPPSGWNIFWNRKNCCWRPKTCTSWLEQWCDESLTVAQRFVFHCFSLFRDPQADTLPETVATCLGLKNSSTSLCELCVEVISTILERMLGHGERVADARRITRRINTDMQARKCMCEKIWEGNKAFKIRIFVRICLKIPRSSFQCFNALRLRLFLEPSSWSSSSHSTLCCLLSWARVAFQARVLIFVAVSNYFYLHAKRSKCSKHLPCSFEA